MYISIKRKNISDTFLENVRIKSFLTIFFFSFFLFSFILRYTHVSKFSLSYHVSFSSLEEPWHSFCPSTQIIATSSLIHDRNAVRLNPWLVHGYTTRIIEDTWMNDLVDFAQIPCTTLKQLIGSYRAKAYARSKFLLNANCRLKNGWHLGRPSCGLIKTSFRRLDIRSIEFVKKSWLMQLCRKKKIFVIQITRIHVSDYF